MLSKILSVAGEEEGTFLPVFLTMLLLDEAEDETNPGRGLPYETDGDARRKF